MQSDSNSPIQISTSKTRYMYSIIPPNSSHHAEVNVRSKRKKKDKKSNKNTKEQNKVFVLKAYKSLKSLNICGKVIVFTCGLFCVRYALLITRTTHKHQHMSDRCYRVRNSSLSLPHTKVGTLDQQTRILEREGC